MKPEGCFSSRHAAAALWSEHSTTRRLFGKEQSTTQSRQMMGRKMHRSVIFRSQCLSSKLAHLQEVRKQYHCFQMPVRSFDDPFMWSTGLAHCRWKALTNSTPGKHQQIRNKRVCQRLKQSNWEPLQWANIEKHNCTYCEVLKYYSSQPIRSTARAQSCLGVAKQSSVLKPVQLLNRRVSSS